MIINLKQNEHLRKYYKKPSFLDNNFLEISIKLLMVNKKDEFLKKIIQKKLTTDKIFRTYFYIEYVLEKKQKPNVFLLNFIHNKLFTEHMYILPNIIDKQIYDYLKTNYNNFIEIKDKNKIFVKEYDVYLKLRKLVNNASDYKSTTKDVKELLDYTRYLIKIRKLTTNIAKETIEDTRQELIYSLCDNITKLSVGRKLNKKLWNI
jgi:hypothetical protein